MGLLSFLKRENERLRAPLKAQAYHTTTPSNPPVRGTYPIPGKKPVRKHVPRRIDTNEPSSPITGVPRAHTSPHLPERPTTAPGTPRRNSSQRASSRRRRESRAPPVSFRQPRAPTPEEIHFEQNPIIKPPPRPASSRGRSSSLTSRAASAVAWVDLLDAQHKIQPADFRARVAATGARDYGEDVADRNIALNGGPEPARPSMSSRNTSFHGSISEKDAPFHLRRLAASPEATRSLTGSHSRYLPAEELERPSSRGFPALEPAPEYSWPSREDSLPSAAPTRERSASGSAHERQRADHLARNRRSMHAGLTYAASSNDLSGAMARPASLRRGLSEDGKRRPRTSSASSDLTLPPEVPKLTLAARRRLSHSRMRSGTVDSESSVYHSLDSACVPASIRTGPTKVPDFDPRPMSSGSERSTVRPTFAAPDWANMYRLGRIDIESTVDPSASAAPAPYIRRGDAGPALSSYDRPRNQPPRGRTRLDEIAETVPLRGSSLRHSSVSSATPTTDSVWSAPFRAHSLHTAQTSIDVPPSPAFPSNLSTCRDDGYLGSPVTVVRKERSSSFNMDDYLSDEDDLEGDARPRKSPDDEGLLFNDTGYGFRGLLPGLFDAIPEFPPEELPLTQPLSPTHIFQHSVGARDPPLRSPSRSSTSSAGSLNSEEYHSVASKPRPASRVLSDEGHRSDEYEDVLNRARALREEIRARKSEAARKEDEVSTAEEETRREGEGARLEGTDKMESG